MMPMPFVTNDAIILSKNISLWNLIWFF
jgi:hypothetical protein